jgi:hypothetical protein
MTGFASKRARSRDFEKDIIESMSKELAREIDKELLDDLMIDVLTKDGWIQTKVNPAFTDIGMSSGRFEDWYAQTGEWCHLYAQGDCKLLKGQWLFKDPRDATMFILKWA